jgi:hypothetical protein
MKEGEDDKKTAENQGQTIDGEVTSKNDEKN